MGDKTFTDEIDLFDNIDDLINFTSVTDNCYDLADIWTNNSDELQASDPIFSGTKGVSDLSPELVVPYEDIIQVEWLSNFVEDSFSSEGLTMNKENITLTKEVEPLAVANYEFQMSSPVSVLESSSSSSSSSSSCSGDGSSGKMIPLCSTTHGPQRARSKRPRPTVFNPRATMELLVPVQVSVESENLLVPDQKKKKKKPKKLDAEFNDEKRENQNQTGQGVRKCMHCEITKTPQWRAGPMGPKTLCNACGVRHKSGRLFPEYRPAASPTFVPSLHSNSHKKVVEMRSKGMPDRAELVPNMNPQPDYM